jgi:rhodanese-related sulfurtransferase
MEPGIIQDNFFLRPENLLFICAIVMSGAMLIWPLISRNAVKEIDALVAVQLINYKDALVLDVRDDSEYATGHLPGAKHIPVAKIEERLHELEKYKEKPIVLIYKGGVRTGKVGAILRENGFIQVNDLKGGIDAWRRANLPIVKR